MKNIKDITISIFAIIGFVFILSSFNNQSQETHSTPESHVWELWANPGGQYVSQNAFMYNKVTGEVRKYNASALDIDKEGTVENISDITYAVMKPAK